MKKIFIGINIIALSLIFGCGSSPVQATQYATGHEQSINVSDTSTDQVNLYSSENSDVSGQLSKSIKQQYIDRLNELDLGFANATNNAITTKAMFEESCNEHKAYDDLLNEIYGTLQTQLSTNDMNNLQSEEIQWINYRDSKAASDSADVKGGSLEKVFFEQSLSDSTKQRCYVLVNEYMK